MKQRLRFMLSLTTLLAMGHALGADYHIGDLHIAEPHARATVPGQSSGAVYVNIENNGKAADKLLAITSPAAKSAALHSMQMDGNVMRMREAGELELKPSARITMQPGNGYHIMLVDLKRALNPGEKVPLTLRFEKAGKIDIEATVDNR